jgi:hypothetical protein
MRTKCRGFGWEVEIVTNLLSRIEEVSDYFKCLTIMFYRVAILHFIKYIFETLQFCKVIVINHMLRML